MTYYTAIVLIQVMAALVMVMIISSTPIISHRMKWYFIAEFILLALISTFEWLNIRLNGSDESLRWLHYGVKATEFILIPVMLGVGILMLSLKKMHPIVVSIVIINIALQIMSVFSGFIFYMNENNVYIRGRFYSVYVALYALEVMILAIEIIRAGTTFQGGSPAMVFVGAVFCGVGIGIQLVFPENKTAFLVGEMSFTMCYIYFNNLILQTDKLTGLLNRWSYEKKLDTINYETCLMIFDLDCFKTINDNFGHRAGDECLKATADMLRQVFSDEGRVYRIGGDEFCVIMHRAKKYRSNDRERVYVLLTELDKLIMKACEEDPRYTGISAGFAYTDPDFSIHWAVEEADHMMYLAKEEKHVARA